MEFLRKHCVSLYSFLSYTNPPPCPYPSLRDGRFMPSKQSNPSPLVIARRALCARRSNLIPLLSSLRGELCRSNPSSQLSHKKGGILIPPRCCHSRASGNPVGATHPGPADKLLPGNSGLLTLHKAATGCPCPKIPTGNQLKIYLRMGFLMFALSHPFDS